MPFNRDLWENAIMKKSSLAILVVAFVFGLPTSTPLRADSPVIKVSSDPWEPWVLGSEGGAATGGVAVEAAEELFKRLGLETEINIYPYERCLDQMKSGDRDVLLMVKKTPEREQFMLFSDVAAREFQSIYYSPQRMAGFEWNDWDDLKPYTVGIVQGFNYGEFAPAAEKYGIKTESVASDTQNIRKLLAGRVDLVILNRSTANYYMEQNPEARGKLEPASKNISFAEFHFGLSKNGKAATYLSGVNEALRDMKADGTLDRILGKLY